MYKGFVNAVEVDFSIPENREKMLDAFKQVDEEKGLTCPLIIGGERIFTEKKFESLNPAKRKFSDIRVRQALSSVTGL